MTSEKIINSTKLLPGSVCKARNLLLLVRSYSSTGKTVYKYNINEVATKGSPKKNVKNAL